MQYFPSTFDVHFISDVCARTYACWYAYRVYVHACVYNHV